MFGYNYYHGLLRKYVSIFGTLFNDLKIERRDANGNLIQTITVPIEYSPASKINALRNRAKRTDPDSAEDDYVAIQLPRMGFEITSIAYDPDRQLQPTIRNKTIIDGDPDKVNTQFIPVPYTITFSLYIMGKNQDDNLQIYEKIVPFFTPTLTVSARLIPEMKTVYDIPVELISQEFSDNYDTDLTERRILTWTFTFQMKVLFFGPITKQGVIKKVQVDFYTPRSGGPITGDDMEQASRVARIIETPGLTANGQPTTVLNNSIPYLQIKSTDNYGFVEQYEEFNDGKHYNPVTGQDEPINS